MSIREQQPEIEQENETTFAATDSALRQLDVAKGREKRLTEQVDKLERRLLDKESELTSLQRELRARSEIVDEIQRTLSWRVTKPLRAARRLFSRS
ncbi:MAG: hypothetical protein H0U30_03780 [Actinobacteria bacterium]|nr:hypothetical protein [Actinomycetota bacterium]